MIRSNGPWARHNDDGLFHNIVCSGAMARSVHSHSRARAVYDRHRRSYGVVLRRFQRDLRTALAKEGLRPILTYRLKEFDSYVDKLARLRESQNRGRIVVRDLFGLRVVCPFLNETERVQDLLVRYFQVEEIEHKGADRPLAEFGYESVHVLVRLPKESLQTLPPNTKALCEVQVRTILQHAWAQIEHELVYKADRSVPKSAVRRKLAAVSATLTLADVVFQETRDDLSEMHAQGVRRRESAHSLVFDDGIGPLTATPREVSQVAKRDHTLSDPKTRELEYLIIKALRAHSDGELGAAVEHYDEILRMRLPNRAIRSMIYNHRGIAYLSLSRADRAARDFTSAVRWNRENFRAHFNLGLALRALGKATMALAQFERARNAPEVAGEALYASAQILSELGRRRAALKACDKALAAKPSLEGAKNLRERLKKRAG